MTRYLVRFALAIATAVLVAGCTAESKKARFLERAEGYYKAGDYEKARIEYQTVLQRYPDDRTAYERLALIWFDRGATMRALVYLSKMRLLAPENLDLRLKRAQLILSLGNVTEARKEALAILERSSSIPEALVLLTDTVRDPEDFKTADEILQKYGERNTSFEIASANLARLRGDRAKAKAGLQRAIALDPKSPAAHTAMAAFYLDEKNANQAGAQYKIAAELSPLRSVARVQQAEYLAQTGAVQAAIASLTEITRQVPDYLPAWRALAQIALFEKRYDDSLKLIQNVLARNPSDYEAQIQSARVWLAKGDAKRAIGDLQHLSKAYPGIGLEQYHLALAHLQNNDRANAIIALQQTVLLFPENIEAILLLAQLNIQAGTPQPAALAMAVLVKKRPDLIQAYLLLVEATKALGNLDETIRAITQNLSQAPQNAQLHYVLGLIFSQQQKTVEARQSFEKALEVSPDNLPAVIALVNLDLKEGKTDLAMRRSQALMAKDPKLAVGHFLAAKTYAAQDKWSEAEAAAVDTIDLEANHTGAYDLLVESFTARKDQPETISKLEAFLAKHPNELLAVLLAGQIYTQMNQFTKAREVYEKHLATQPTATLVLNNLASLHSEHLHDSERALELARKARELEPISPVIADTLGWIMYQRKMYDEALPLLEESAKSLPENPEVQFHFGMVSHILGHNEAALPAFRVAATAPRDFPGMDEAKRQLAQLEKSVAPSSTPP